MYELSKKNPPTSAAVTTKPSIILFMPEDYITTMLLENDRKPRSGALGDEWHVEFEAAATASFTPSSWSFLSAGRLRKRWFPLLPREVAAGDVHVCLCSGFVDVECKRKLCKDGVKRDVERRFRNTVDR